MNATYPRLCCLVLAAFVACLPALARDAAQPVAANAVSSADLPREARRTLEHIRRGPPFPYAKDGVVFGNHERILPGRPRGYYHEFTVPTPGIRGRGAQRLIVGGAVTSSTEVYYTRDHYASFMRVQD